MQLLHATAIEEQSGLYSEVLHSACCLQGLGVLGVHESVLFQVELTEQWNRLPRKAESLFLEIFLEFNSHLDMVLGKLLWVFLLERQC